MDQEVLSQLLPVGTILENRYRIDRYLSSGGFGNTYLARDTKLDCIVAIKEFFLKEHSSRCADGRTVQNTTPTSRKLFHDYQEKFVTEAKRITQLHSDHIVRVIDLFDDNGTSYYVMDFLDGMSLKEHLKIHGPMSESVACNIALQLTEALEAVHAAGFYHLDIKPNNVMLTTSGKAVLVDFGASKQMSTDGGATKHSMMVHTPGYAPPEQTDQRADRIGPWTDFFALGATLYAMLTATTPPSVSYINDEGANAFTFPQHVSMYLRNAVINMMQPGTKRRPQNAVEVKRLLTADNQQTGGTNTHSGYSDANESTIGYQQTRYTTQYQQPPTRNEAIRVKPKPKRRTWIWPLVSVLILLIIISTIHVLSYRANMDNIVDSISHTEESTIENADPVTSGMESLKELTDLAKNNGNGWTEAEWKEALKVATIAIIPMIEESYKFEEKCKNSNSDDPQVLSALQEEANNFDMKYKDLEKQFTEFRKTAESYAIGDSLMSDDTYAQELYEELGISEFMADE